MRLRLFSAMFVTVPLAFAACSGDDDSGPAAAGKGGSAGKGGAAGKGGSAGKGSAGKNAAGKGGSTSSGGTGATEQAGGAGGAEGGAPATGGAGGTSAGAAGASEAGAAGVAGGGETPVSFKVRIENHSGDTASPTPISPGVWVLSPHADPLFTAGTPDRGLGLEHLAEDGANASLASALLADHTLAATGTFDTAVGASAAGPAAPGQAFEFTFDATPASGTLSFATMFGQSSDTFIGPGGSGIALFDAHGAPLPAHDVTLSVSLWDAGTEKNEAPRMGPDQAPREPQPNTGPGEGKIARFSDTTRALPIPSAIVDVSVTEASGTFTITFTNVSGTRHAIDTPISPVFYATHDATWSLFTPGMPAPTGLEALAEDGSPAGLVTANTSAAGTGTVGAMTIADGASGAGPALTGAAFTLAITPDAAHPLFSIASMVGTTNDAFLAFQPSGVALLAANGSPRAAADVRADILAKLAVWDAGTEANEVPGIGPNQAPRQVAPNTGAADPDTTVRLYADSKNDLAGPMLGGFVSVAITHLSGNDFQVRITDTADTTAFPGKVAPLAWALHAPATQIFTDGGKASAGLEKLAEDGNPSTFATELAALSGVGNSGVVDTADGTATAGPLAPGQSFVFTVTPDLAHRFFSFAEMAAPTNDTFIALDPGGVALLDEGGAVRSDSAIAADVLAHLFAWDAGTEANQAGAAGPDQVGHQAAPNTGAGEGSGKVRTVDDPVWPFPPASALVKVTVTPL
jgi:hypothetical protein